MSNAYFKWQEDKIADAMHITDAKEHFWKLWEKTEGTDTLSYRKNMISNNLV